MGHIVWMSNSEKEPTGRSWDIMKDFRDDPTISDDELKEIEKFIKGKEQ